MKKTKLPILLALLMFTSGPLLAQQCNCAVAFKWAKTAFEENDAGFGYIIDEKGNEAYQMHNSIFEKKVKRITNPDLCVLAMQAWSKFFRVGHFDFIVNGSQAAKSRATRNAISQSSYVQDYDANTMYLRIPTFASNYKKEIDSVIKSNSSKILSRKNLIIDIRDNGGGDDASYNEIIPILYTNPIRNVTVARLSTPNNNKIWDELISRKNISESYKGYYKHYQDTLNANLGKFIRLSNSDVSTTTYDIKYPFPQNIGIIINGNNGSTAEQFLLAAKQSKKVKLFGTTTMGELDISNMYSITSPDKQFTLWYCTSKSLRIPENTIDNKGIAPDFYIDKSIPKENWLPYVTDIMKNW